MTTAQFRNGPNGYTSGKSWFIYSATFDNGRPCPIDLDRASEFVVGAQLTAVISTWVALLLTVICDSSVQDPDRLKIPILSSLTLRPSFAKRLRPWLGRFILVSADTQFCSGLAFLITSLVLVVNSPDRSESFSSPFMTLAVYYLCMISSIHQAALLSMRSEITKHRAATAVRVLLLICFAILLVIMVDMNYFAFEPLFIPLERIVVGWWKRPLEDQERLEMAVPPIIMVWIYGTSIFQLFWPSTTKRSPVDDWVRFVRWVLGRSTSRFRIRECMRWFLEGSVRWLFTESKSRFKPRRIAKALLQWLFFSNVATAFIVGMLSAICATTFMGMQKYAKAPQVTETDRRRYPGIISWCDLKNGNEKLVTFGQLTTLILAFAPFYSVITAISDEKDVEEAEMEKDLEKGESDIYGVDME